VEVPSLKKTLAVKVPITIIYDSRHSNVVF